MKYDGTKPIGLSEIVESYPELVKEHIHKVSDTDYATSSTPGIVIADGTNTAIGISPTTNKLRLETTTDGVIKTGTSMIRAVMPHQQHIAAFYGLAKAAGADEKDSSLALGTYSQTAKNAIQTMLGVESGVSFVETVSGSTPSIAGEPNVRYMCEEVSTISITPPAYGTIDVVFESGTTPAVLTVTPPTGLTMKWPVWFNAASLETNTTYEICIMDGQYGMVMSW